MTGAKVKVKRFGRWESVDIDLLSDKELVRAAKENPDIGWKIAKRLARWIRDKVYCG